MRWNPLHFLFGAVPGQRSDLLWFNNTQRFLGTLALAVLLTQCLSHWGDWAQMFRSLCLSLTVAGGCIVAGAALGFIFGIPRTLAAGRNEGGDTEGANGGMRSNTNLERVSDWLTGMIVGAGLVEMQNLAEKFRALAQSLAEGFAGDGNLAFAYGYAMFLMIFCGVGGFLIGYVITRRFLPLTFARGESEASDAEGQKQGILRNVTDLITAMGIQPPGSLKKRPAAGVTDETGGAEETDEGDQSDETSSTASAGEAESTAATDDPNKGKFGRRPADHGRRLSAEVIPLGGDSSKFYRVVVRVTCEDPHHPLADPVTFHLHPTFPTPIQTVTPKGGVASLELLVWGSFTIGAVLDKGATRLELDLAELPGVPEAFRLA